MSLTARMLRARVAARQAQAHLDALNGDPVAKAWVAVMDSLWEWVRQQDELRRP